MQVILII